MVERSDFLNSGLMMTRKPDMVSAFLGMDTEEQRKVLISQNKAFAGMAAIEQSKVLNNIKDETINVAAIFDKGNVPEGTPEHTTAQQIFLKAEPFIKPLAEAGALTAGAIIGAPVVPPFGSIAGAGLGFGLVRNVFKQIEGFLGLRDTAGIAEETKGAVADVAEGVLLESGGQVVGPALRAGKKAITAPFKRANLTQEGAKEAAIKRFKEESRGTELTQPQVDENVRIARELETKLRKIDPNFRFTQGQLTNDASAISLERSLARKKGQDLSQEQREHAVEVLRQYYNKKVLSTGTVEDFVTYTQRMSKELEASTKQAVSAVESEVARLNRHVEPQVFGTAIHKTLSAGKDQLRRKASVLYDAIPNVKLNTSKLSSDITSFVKAEDRIIEPRTKQMISLVRSKFKPRATKPPKPPTVVDSLTRTGALTKKPIEQALVSTDYQVLRKLHSRIGKNYRASMSGATPNLEDARQLFRLQGLVDDAMRQVEKASPSAAKAYKKATSFYKEEFIPTYRQGTVADVLQRGARGEETRIAKANIAQAFDSPGGVDDLVRAVGKEQASKMMKDYYAFDLINTAVDAEGKVVASKSLRWLSKNGSKLKKLGLFNEFKVLGSRQRQVDILFKNRDTFNKSVAGRVLETDIDKMITNAFRGSKNFSRTASELMGLVKGNRAAEMGLKKSFGEMLLRESEETGLSFFQSDVGSQEFSKSVAKMTNLFKKFSPAIRVIFKGEPEKLKAIINTQKAYQTLQRTAKSPIGGGSDTFELFGRTLDIVAGSTAPGKWYAFKTIRDMVSRFGGQNVEKYLTKAMFDPDYAQALEAVSRAGKTSETIPLNLTTVVNRLMLRLALTVGSDSKADPKQQTATRGINPPAR